jgi:hypothetical protein
VNVISVDTKQRTTENRARNNVVCIEEEIIESKTEHRAAVFISSPELGALCSWEQKHERRKKPRLKCLFGRGDGRNKDKNR